MLLLDHNLPHQLRDLLASYDLKSETAASRGWERLRNGELVSAAHAAGFDAIWTRDLKFAESATKAFAESSANGTRGDQAASTQLEALCRQFSERLDRNACHFDTGTSCILALKAMNGMHRFRNSSDQRTSVPAIMNPLRKINPPSTRLTGVGRCESWSVHGPESIFDNRQNTFLCARPSRQ